MTCKCSDCGLLGVYQESWSIREMTDYNRNVGALPEKSYYIVCSALQFSLKNEVDALQKNIPKGETDPAAFEKINLKVITTTRTCPKFYKWNPGFSPKEHKEMISDEKLEEIRQENRKSDQKVQLRAALLGAIVGGLIACTKDFITYFTTPTPVNQTSLSQPAQTQLTTTIRP